ncbi:MAG: DUF2256 domain-containing protein [Acidimicrobiia bacterium]|nr:DUF2256 domain-containing protein [Acidimicrobiia bacterium]
MHPDKICATCGRPFAWRKAWANQWDEVRYCSKACRARKPTRVDRALESALRERVADRREVPTDDAARAVGGADWQRLRERARRAARRLSAAGEVELVQGGRRVDANAKGAFRVVSPPGRGGKVPPAEGRG